MKKIMSVVVSVAMVMSQAWSVPNLGKEVKAEGPETLVEMPKKYFATPTELIDPEVFNLTSENDEDLGRIAIGKRPAGQKYRDKNRSDVEAKSGAITCLICGGEKIAGQEENEKAKGLVLYTEEPVIGSEEAGTNSFPNGINTNNFYNKTGQHNWESERGGEGQLVNANHWGASDLRANLGKLKDVIFPGVEKELLVESTIKTGITASTVAYETKDYLYAPRCKGSEPGYNKLAPVTLGEDDGFVIGDKIRTGYFWLRSSCPGNSNYTDFALCAWAVPGVSSVHVYDTGFPAAMAGFKMNLTNVGFTSAALAAQSPLSDEGAVAKFSQIEEVTSVIDNTKTEAPPMYIRLDPAGMSDDSKEAFGTESIEQLKTTSVTTTQGSSKISVANAPAGSRLMVQLAKSDGSVYQYSQTFEKDVDSLDVNVNALGGLITSEDESGIAVKGYAWVELGNPKQTTVFPSTEASGLSFNYTPCPSLNASCDKTNLTSGEQGTITATVVSEFGSKALTWRSSNSNIVKFVDGDDITTESESVSLKFKALNVGTATLTAEYNDTVLASFDVQVSYLDFEGTPYIFDGGYASGVEGPSPTYWLKHGTDAVLVPPEGYKISKVFGDGYDENGLTISEGDNVPDKIYLQYVDGLLTDGLDVKGRFVWDSILPSGSILIDDVPRWQKIFSPITFNLFSTISRLSKIDVNDLESGPKEVRYLLVSESQISVEALNGNEPLSDSEISAILEQKDWQAYNEEGIHLNKDGKYIVYARLEDNVGNVDYLVSKGVVVYSPSELNEDLIEHEKLSIEDKTITFTANGNTIRSIKNGDKLLTKGTDYDELEEDGVITITLRAEYLDSLSAGEYTLEIDYNPQGVEVGASSEGELPAPLTIELKVKRKPAEPIYPSVDEVYKYGTKLSEIELSDDWQWVNEDIALSLGEAEYEAWHIINVEDYDWSSVEGASEEDEILTIKVKVKSEVDKSRWGEPKEISGIMHYIDETGKISVEVPPEQGIVWLKAESDGTSAWYGFYNRTGALEPGSRAYVQWLSKNDPDYEKYLTQSDALIKIGAEGENIWIFRVGVVRPNGERYSNLEETTNLFVQIGDDWNKDEVKGYYIGEAEGESVDTTVTNETCPEGEGLFGVMKLKHFSPYLIYDKLTENAVEKTEDTEKSDISETQSDSNVNEEKSEPSQIEDHSSEEPDEDFDEYDELLREPLEGLDEPEDLEEKTPIKSTGDINSARSISTLGVLTLLSAAYLILRKKKSNQI